MTNPQHQNDQLGLPNLKDDAVRANSDAAQASRGPLQLRPLMGIFPKAIDRRDDAVPVTLWQCTNLLGGAALNP
jgi:hypothetical protein